MFLQDLFSTLNSTIKETLAFHMLINQKEIDQLEKFVDDYNYRLDSDDEFVYISKLFTEENLFDIFIRTHMISSNDIKTRTEIFFLQNNNNEPSIELDEELAINLFNTFLEVIYYSSIKKDNYKSNILTLDLFETAKSKFIESNAIIINDSKNSFTVKEHNLQYICGNVATIGDRIIYKGAIRDIIGINPIINDAQTEFMIQFNTYFIENSVNDKTKFNYHEFLSAKYLNDIIWDKFKSN